MAHSTPDAFPSLTEGAPTRRGALPFDRRGFLAAAGVAPLALQSAAAQAWVGKGNSAKQAISATADTSWVEIDRAALRHNLAFVRSRLAPATRLCAVLKADAYGNGIDLILPELLQGGVDAIGIISNEEAAQVRRGGFRGELMRLRPVSERDAVEAARYRLVEMVGSAGAAARLRSAAHRWGKPLPVNLALDAGGMSREGLDLRLASGMEEAAAILSALHLSVRGIMTHFPVDTVADAAQVLARFRSEAEGVIAANRLDRQRLVLHAANSAATLRLPDAHLAMVRVGGALYGDLLPNPGLMKTMALRSRIVSANSYVQGATVGYDRTFVLARRSRIGLVPCGYSNGYGRAFSNKSQVLVQGLRVPVLGRISMNSLLLDLTDFPQIDAGARVTLFGRDGADEITQPEIEAASGMILTELTIQWGKLNARRLI